jgi:hypothetical protein
MNKQNQAHRHQATQNSGVETGKSLESAASRKGRVPGGLVPDWRPIGLGMALRLEKRGGPESDETNPENMCAALF